MASFRSYRRIPTPLAWLAASSFSRTREKVPEGRMRARTLGRLCPHVAIH
ncbi:hypothetical protein FHR47_001180 [Xanthomonas arboricola]|nr:hypothetical protein [Xanthomonas cannabis]